MKKIIVMLTILLSGMVQAQTFDFNCESGAEYVNTLLLQGGADALIQSGIAKGDVRLRDIPNTQKSSSASTRREVVPFRQGLGFNTSGEITDAWVYVFRYDDKTGVRNLASGEPNIFYVESLDDCTEVLEFQTQDFLEWLGYPHGGDESTEFDEVTSAGNPYGILTSQSIFEGEVQTSEYIVSGDEFDLYIEGLDLDPKNYYGDVDTSLDSAFSINPDTFCTDFDMEGLLGSLIYDLEVIDHETRTYEPLQHGTEYRLRKTYNVTREGYTATQSFTFEIRQHTNIGSEITKNQTLAFIDNNDQSRFFDANSKLHIEEFLAPYFELTPCELGRVNVGSGYRIFAINSGDQYTQLQDGDAIPRGTTHYEITEIGSGQNLVRYEYTECEDITPPCNAVLSLDTSTIVPFFPHRAMGNAYSIFVGQPGPGGFGVSSGDPDHGEYLHGDPIPEGSFYYVFRVSFDEEALQDTVHIYYHNPDECSDLVINPDNVTDNLTEL